MEISGEIHYANVDIDFDVDYLAETLATNHDFVDSTVLHAHVEEYCDSYVADRVSERVDEEIQELRVKVDDLDILHRELRGKIRELEPNNNYVRINDLHKIIEEIVRAEICVAFAAGHHKMQDRLNGTDIGIKEG
tara:strand:+ start:29 stop:433 length:405 start_codon:yes stop_codon:yes gene_type:complete